MKERLVEVSPEWFRQLQDLLMPEEQQIAGELADSHGTNVVMWVPMGNSIKRLVFVRKKPQGGSQ